MKYFRLVNESSCYSSTLRGKTKILEPLQLKYKISVLYRKIKYYASMTFIKSRLSHGSTVERIGLLTVSTAWLHYSWLSHQ